MRIAAWLAVLGISIGANQAADPSLVRARLGDPRAMTPPEIARALEAIRQAINGKAFRIIVGRSPIGPELLFGANGQVHFLRAAANNTLALTEYSGQPARYCEGSPAPGDLVIEYRQAGSGWTVSVRHSTPVEMLSPLYSLLSSSIALTDEGLTEDRTARSFSAPWKPVLYRSTEIIPGGGVSTFSTFSSSGAPPDGVQAIVIDRESLLPVRSELRVKAPPGSNLPASIPILATMEYVPSLAAELRQPDGVRPPDCLPMGMPPRPGFPGP